MATRFAAACLLLGLLPALPASAASGTAEAAEPSQDRFDVVVVDAGHGGDDHGAKGAGGLVEKDVVLDVAKRLARHLKERGVRVIMTRERDRFVSLEDRTSVANQAEADLFVSVHANASRARGARGIETFFASLDATDEDARELAASENLALLGGAEEGAPPQSDDPLLAILGDMIATEHLVESQEFARLAQRELAEAVGARSRGVKQAPFVVLLGVHMPSALLEIGFLTNPRDEQALGRDAERERIADALTRAVLAFGARHDARQGIASSGGEEGP